jgi:KUP system potassium uptake protein
VRERLSYLAVTRSLRLHGAAGPPGLAGPARDRGYPVDPSKLAWFIGRERMVKREDRKGLPWFMETVASFLARNSSETMEYFRLPRDEVVEIGRQFAI